MSTYRDRMEDEHKDLEDKIDRLNAFIEGSVYPTLSEASRTMLSMQLEAMGVYYDCLTVRIELAQGERV